MYNYAINQNFVFLYSSNSMATVSITTGTSVQMTQNDHFPNIIFDLEPGSKISFANGVECPNNTDQEVSFSYDDITSFLLGNSSFGDAE